MTFLTMKTNPNHSSSIHAARSSFLSSLQLVFLIFTCFIVVMATQAAPATIDAKAEPPQFIDAVANQTLEAIKQDLSDVQAGKASAIHDIVNTHILPYTNMEKTTRLAAGRYWNQASDQQKQDLIRAFTQTLIRTYSGAFRQANAQTSLKILPFRGDAKANDVVVKSTLSQGNSAPVNIDYRMENTPEGWKIYDLNVEGIWLIQNYRNQFAQEINRNGVDGLIKALQPK